VETLLAHVLLIFMAASDEGTSTSAALLRALAEALGPGAEISVQGSPAPPTDEALVERVHDRKATAAVRLVWDDAARTRVAMHVYLARSDEIHDQSLTFQRSDPAEERGRALGFVIASYLLPPPAARPAPVVAAVRAPAPEPARWALEGFGTAALSIQGEGGGLGGGFGVRFWAGERWGVRAGLHLRTGSVVQAQASSLWAGAALGLFRVLAGGDGPRGVSLVGRAEGLLVYDALTHLSADDPQPVRLGRFLPAAAAVLELEWRLAPAAALHVGAGVEEALGKTDVFVHDIRVALIGRSRIVAEAGFRTRF
jgi:hypothetical protein